MLARDYRRNFRRIFKHEFCPTKSWNCYNHFCFEFSQKGEYENALNYVKANPQMFAEIKEIGAEKNYKNEIVYTLDFVLANQDFLEYEEITSYDAEIKNLKEKLKILENLKKVEIAKKRKEQKIKELQEQIEKISKEELNYDK